MEKVGIGVPSPIPNRQAASPARGLFPSLGRILAVLAVSLVAIFFIPSSAWADVILANETPDPDSTGTPEPAATASPAPAATASPAPAATDEPEPAATDEPEPEAPDEPEPAASDEPITLAEEQFNVIVLGIAILITVTSVNTVRGFR